jgi:ABC-type lipoprotein export system ATPase subunit/ABC-type antimicrobial peptide transport system permease subunit
MFFLVGKSGCGKTTLLNILGLLDNFTDGEYFFDGKNVRKMSAHEKDLMRASSIGFVFQQFQIVGKYNIGRNISLAKEICDGKCSKKEVDEILAKVGLNGYRRRKCSQLSGGQLQRAAVARCLIKNPDIILADEPTGALDSTNSAMILGLLKEISKDKLVIVVTHDRPSAERFGDTILEICDGKIIAEKIPKNAKSGRAESKTDTQYLNKQSSGRAEMHRKKRKRQSSAMPILSTIRLGLLNLRSMWLRTAMTILVSVFALSFIGFSLMMSGFNAADKLMEYIENENIPFIPIEAKQSAGSGIFAITQDAVIKPEMLNKLDDNNIAFATRTAFIEPINMGYINYDDLPATGILKKFYQPTVDSIVEYDNLDDIGIKLLDGEMPNEENEVLITPYHLEAYRRFGRARGKTAELITYDSNNWIYYAIPVYTAGTRITGYIESGNMPYTLHFNDIPLIKDTDYTIQDSKINFDFTLTPRLCTGAMSGHYDNAFLLMIGVAESFYTQIPPQKYNFYIKNNETTNFSNENLNDIIPYPLGMDIRYIRDFTNGSTANSGNFFCEIKAITSDGKNVALNRTATSNGVLYSNNEGGGILTITNGNTNSDNYASFYSGNVYVEIDLGQIYNIENIKVWHYYNGNRTFHNTKMLVSADGVNWTAVFDSEITGEYAENSSGRTTYLNSDNPSESISITKPMPLGVKSFDDIKGINIGDYTVVGIVDMNLSKYADIISLDTLDDNYNLAKEYEQTAAARDEYLNCLYAPKGTYKPIYDFSYGNLLRNWTLQIQGEKRIFQTETLSNSANPQIEIESDYFIWANEDADFGQMRNSVIVDISFLPNLISNEETAIIANLPDAEKTEYLKTKIIGKKLTAGWTTRIQNTGSVFSADEELQIVGVYLIDDSIPNLFFTADFYDNNPISLVQSVLIDKKNLQNILAIDTFSIGEKTADESPISYTFYPNVNGANDIFILQNYLGLIITIFNSLSFVFIFFAVLITISLISNSVKTRQNDIGILRSLGVSKFSVSLIFIFECLLIAIIEIALTAAVCISCYNIMQSVLEKYIGKNIAEYNIISMTFGRIAKITGIAVGALALSLILPLTKINSKQPVEIIQKSND